MDLQTPANLPMQDELSSAGAMPPVPPPSPVPPPMQAMPTLSDKVPDDMFSGVDRSTPPPPPPVQAMPQASSPSPTMSPMAPAPVAPARVLSALPEAEHPPVLHYILIALGVVVVLGLIAGGIWFFAIRRPTREVMETLPAAVETTSTTEDGGVDTGLAPGVMTDESIADTNPFDEPEVIPSKPVVTPPEGVNVPPPTSIDPNGAQQVLGAPGASAPTNTVPGLSSDPTTAQPVTPPVVIDQDADGLSDTRETELGTNAAVLDSDVDGLSDGDEVLKYRTNPLVPDTDGDSYPDGVEVQKGFNPLGAGQCANPTCTL